MPDVVPGPVESRLASSPRRRLGETVSLGRPAAARTTRPLTSRWWSRCTACGWDDRRFLPGGLGAAEFLAARGRRTAPRRSRSSVARRRQHLLAPATLGRGRRRDGRRRAAAADGSSAGCAPRRPTGSGCSAGRWAATAPCTWPASRAERVAAVAVVEPGALDRPRRRQPQRLRRRRRVRATTPSWPTRATSRASPVRIDCGTGDPFYRDVAGLRRRLPGPTPTCTSRSSPARTSAAFWRRVLPAQLALAGRARRLSVAEP